MRTNRARRQSRSHSSNLNYDSLETRCVLTGAHQIFVPLPEGINLIRNESFATSHESVNGLYDAQSLPGWQPVQSNANSLNQINIQAFPGRGSVMHLDSSTGLDQVYQDVPTEQGRRYLISFDSRPSAQVYQQGHSVFSTQFEVYWNGTLIATIQPRYHWKTNTLEVIGGNGDFSRLTFSETLSGSGDRVGALINHIRVVDATKLEIYNGGFEKFEGSAMPNRAYAHLSGIGSVPGWSATAPPNNRMVMNLEPSNVNSKGPQGTVLNLNAHQGFRDSVSTELSTVPGAVYYVRFLAQGNAINELRIRWGNDLALSVRPDTNWESIGLLVQASSLKTSLTFMEGLDTNGDIRIDNVEIYRIDNPEISSRPAQPTPTASFSAYASLLSDTTVKKRKL